MLKIFVKVTSNNICNIKVTLGFYTIITISTVQYFYDDYIESKFLMEFNRKVKSSKKHAFLNKRIKYLWFWFYLVLFLNPC